MKRRTFLLGTGSAAVGGSALLGSGAFSRVESQRNVTIQVAQDPDAYLGMDKCSIDGSTTPNSSYAHLDENGHLGILMNPDNPTIGDTPLGQGINSDSRMWVDNVFQLCNQGKEDICVYIEDHEHWPRAPEEYDEERRVDFYLGADRESSIVGEENEFLLPLGTCVCVGLKTNSKGLSEGDELLENLDNEIQIIADVECSDDPQIPPEEENGGPEEVETDHPAISWVSFCVEEGSISAEDISIEVTQVKANGGDFQPVQIQWESNVSVSNVTLKGGQELWHFEAGGLVGTATMGEGDGPGPQDGQSFPGGSSPCPDGSCGVKFEWSDDEFEPDEDHQDTC